MATTQIPLRLRGETLGFDHPDPWALGALHLLFATPRVFLPLAVAWDRRNPGTRKALSRLTDMGFVAYQPGIVMDTLNGTSAEKAGRKVDRFRITAKGRRLLEAIEEDSGVLQEFTPKTSPQNRLGVQRILESANVESAKAPDGVSLAYMGSRSGLVGRTCRWWVGWLAERGYIRKLDHRVADVREVIPPHWRATRLLARQVADIIAERALPLATESLKTQFRLGRSRFLADIDPSRVGLSGATDYDHDVGTQRVLAELLRSPRFVSNGRLEIEPRMAVPTDKTVVPWQMIQGASQTIQYQPDALHYENGDHGKMRSIIEYERYQTRRDGWAHIERFLGWVSTSVFPFESVTLRFVVASKPRSRSYTELIEAYGDWLLTHNEHRPTHNVRLEVAAFSDLQAASDPLDPRVWSRLSVPRYQGEGRPVAVLHAPSHTPYDTYF